MSRRVCLLALLVCATATAAPVPKEKPDPLPDGALVRLGSSRFRGPHTDGVTFSKDGKTLYAPRVSVVQRWDSESGKLLPPVELDVKHVRDIRVCGDRVFVLMGELKRTWEEDDKTPLTVRVFGLPGGKKVSEFEVDGGGDLNNSPGEGSRRRVASADGKRYAAIPMRGKKLSVYNAETGERVTELTLKDDVVALSLSGTGGSVLASGFRTAAAIDVASGEQVFSLAAPLGLAEWSPDGKTLVGLKMVEPQGNVPKVLQPTLTAVNAAGEQLHSLPLPGNSKHLQFVGNDAVVAVHHTSGLSSPRPGLAVTRWNLTTGKADWTVPAAFQAGRYDRPFARLAVAPDGKRFVLSDCDQAMTVYDAATGKRVDENAAHPEAVRWVGWSADGKTVTTVSHRDIRTWDAATGELKAAVAPPEFARADFAGATRDLFVWSAPHADPHKAEVIAWDRAKGKVAWRVGCGFEQVHQVAAAGERVVVAGGEKGMAVQSVAVFDQAGKKTGDWSVPKNYMQMLGGMGTVTADGIFVPTGTRGTLRPTVVKLALDTGEVLATLDETRQKTAPLSPHTSADGKTVLLSLPNFQYAVADPDGKVRHTGRHATNVMAGISLSRDGTKMMEWAMDAQPVRAVELTSKGKTWTLDTKGGVAAAVAFSPDGTKAVVGYRDGTALVWDVSK